jgi:hypothetical protein
VRRREHVRDTPVPGHRRSVRAPARPQSTSPESRTSSEHVPRLKSLLVRGSERIRGHRLGSRVGPVPVVGLGAGPGSRCPGPGRRKVHADKSRRPGAGRLERAPGQDEVQVRRCSDESAAGRLARRPAAPWAEWSHDYGDVMKYRATCAVEGSAGLDRSSAGPASQLHVAEDRPGWADSDSTGPTRRCRMGRAGR